MLTTTQDSFLQLVRLGIGTSNDTKISNDIDWAQLKALADAQGLAAVALDGVEHLSENKRPPRIFLLNWIGETLQNEKQYVTQQNSAHKMVDLFHENDIRTYVLKGLVIAECYPKPACRLSADLDCFLIPNYGYFDAWSMGNDLIKAKGFDVLDDFYKNSKFLLPELTVENHQYFTPFRGNKSLKAFEKFLQKQISNDKGEDRIEGTWLYRPSVITSTLFLIEHTYSHFLHEGLTWRMVLDWEMFSRKHNDEIDWKEFNMRIDEFGFRKFYNSYNRIGQYLLGEFRVESLELRDKRMLEDIWTPLDLHETVRGWRGKFALAGNTWRARWKYRYFTNMSWITALWIQVKGFLFIKKPKLD